MEHRMRNAFISEYVLLLFSHVPQQMSLVMLYRFDVDWSGLDTSKPKE